jgi:mRNA-degrading endonuclease RelE of RelBE toxin-antitoxin system
VSYFIEITKRAEKDLDQLDRVAEQQVRERLKMLSLQPTSTQFSQPVKMAAGERKSRVREWRIFFEIDEINRRIIILSVRHRRQAYRDLK